MGLLDRVVSEAPAQPSRVYLYAQEKWGKTSFAAYAPKPIFLMTAGETGLLDLINYGQIGPTPHFPEDFKRWPDLLDAVRAVADDPHDYQTLVVDTANGAERLLADHILATEFDGVMGGKNGYGSYGKGDLACVPHWGEFLRELDRVRVRRRMSIVLLAHSRIKSVNNPEGDDYDQLRPEGLDKLWPLTHKWASVIAAGTYKVFVKDDKAQGGRDRVIRLRGTAAVVGGNRYGLPDEIACGGSPKAAFGAFAKALQDAKAKGRPAPPPAHPPAAPPSEPANGRARPGAADANPTEAEVAAASRPADRPTPAPTPAPVPAPEPAAPDAESPAAEAPTPPRIGRQLVEELLGLCHSLELSWREARAEYAESLGIDTTDVRELAPEPAMKLRDLLRAQLAEKQKRARKKPAEASAN